MEVLLIVALAAAIAFSVECPGKPATPCWGTSTHTCPDTEAACAADKCCSTFSATDCSGTAPGTKCVSYSNCDTTCCTKTYTGCGGTVSKPCSSTDCDQTCCDGTELECNGPSGNWPTHQCAGMSQAECIEHGACCRWTVGETCMDRPCGSGIYQVPPGSCVHCGCLVEEWDCAKKSCSGLSESDCSYCGCTPAGTCPKKACSTLAVGNCAYCGCTVTGNCPPKACTTYGFDCSPTGTLKDCKDCGCECCYKITTECEISSGFTCGGLVIDPGGQVLKTGGTITVCSYWQKAPDPTARFWSTLPVGLQIKGGNPCCP